MRPFSLQEVQNTFNLFESHANQSENENLYKEVLPKKSEVERIKEALMQELVESLETLETGKDPYSETWHQAFEKSVKKINNIFSQIGLSSDEISMIILEHNQRCRKSMWSR